MIILLSADDVNYWAAYHPSPEDEITVGESTPHSQCLFFPWKAKQTYLTSKSQGNKSIEAMFNSFWVCVSVAGAKIFRGNGTRVMKKVFIKQKNADSNRFDRNLSNTSRLFVYFQIFEWISSEKRGTCLDLCTLLFSSLIDHFLWLSTFGQSVGSMPMCVGISKV